MNSLGIERVDYVGYENCEDPNVARTIAGSATLYDIKERGAVRCALMYTTDWYYSFMTDQVRGKTNCAFLERVYEILSSK